MNYLMARWHQTSKCPLAVWNILFNAIVSQQYGGLCQLQWHVVASTSNCESNICTIPSQSFQILPLGGHIKDSIFCPLRAGITADNYSKLHLFTWYKSLPAHPAQHNMHSNHRGSGRLHRGVKRMGPFSCGKATTIETNSSFFFFLSS